MKRNEVKGLHEEAVINSFQEYLKMCGEKLIVLERPDPPDAIIQLNRKKTWLEITDAFISKEYAQSITTYAASDKRHVPAQRTLRIEPDKQFLATVISVVKAKYSKNSIHKIYKKYGSGILLVGLYSPFTGKKEIAEIRKEINALMKTNIPIFFQIYLYDKAHTFYKV